MNSLRSSKEQGQSNFANPGTMLLGVGADFDIAPRLRVSANVNHLWFQHTAILQDLRPAGHDPQRHRLGSERGPRSTGRFMTQNIVFRLSGAVLDAGTGFRDLFTNTNRTNVYYSVLLNAIVSY